MVLRGGIIGRRLSGRWCQARSGLGRTTLVDLSTPVFSEPEGQVSGADLTTAWSGELFRA
jgi:hypothetical protein